MLDYTQRSLEKGLRNAAANNKIDDVKIFLKYVYDINAQDNGENRRTALHCAAIKGHKDCCRLLIEEGAKQDIPDAKGDTAIKYLNNIKFEFNG